MQKIAVGVQDFETLRINGYFYVDKTEFLREWWESGDSVTLINRPRRFGKSMAVNMLSAYDEAAGLKSLDIPSLLSVVGLV